MDTQAYLRYKLHNDGASHHGVTPACNYNKEDDYDSYSDTSSSSSCEQAYENDCGNGITTRKLTRDEILINRIYEESFSSSNSADGNDDDCIDKKMSVYDSEEEDEEGNKIKKPRASGKHSSNNNNTNQNRNNRKKDMGSLYDLLQRTKALDLNGGEQMRHLRLEPDDYLIPWNNLNDFMQKLFIRVDPESHIKKFVTHFYYGKEITGYPNLLYDPNVDGLTYKMKGYFLLGLHPKVKNGYTKNKPSPLKNDQQWLNTVKRSGYANVIITPVNYSIIIRDNEEEEEEEEEKKKKDIVTIKEVKANSNQVVISLSTNTNSDNYDPYDSDNMDKVILHQSINTKSLALDQADYERPKLYRVVMLFTTSLSNPLWWNTKSCRELNKMTKQDERNLEKVENDISNIEGRLDNLGMEKIVERIKPCVSDTSSKQQKQSSTTTKPTKQVVHSKKEQPVKDGPLNKFFTSPPSPSLSPSPQPPPPTSTPINKRTHSSMMIETNNSNDNNTRPHKQSKTIPQPSLEITRLINMLNQSPSDFDDIILNLKDICLTTNEEKKKQIEALFGMNPKYCFNLLNEYIEHVFNVSTEDKLDKNGNIIKGKQLEICLYILKHIITNNKILTRSIYYVEEIACLITPETCCITGQSIEDEASVITISIIVHDCESEKESEFISDIYVLNTVENAYIVETLAKIMSSLSNFTKQLKIMEKEFSFVMHGPAGSISFHDDNFRNLFYDLLCLKKTFKYSPTI